MNKKLLLLPFIALFGLVSCGDEEEVQEEPKVLDYEQRDMTLNYSTKSIDINEKITLSVEDEKLNRKIVWESENSSVASVSNSGVVTGLSIGETTIKAKYETLVATCTINVYNSFSVPFIELDFNEATLGIDGFVDVNVVTKFKGESVEKLIYTWSSDDENVVKVTNYNTKATLVAVGSGTTSVWVSTTCNGVEIFDCISITVLENVATFDVKNAALDENGFTVKVKRNKTITLDIDVYVDGVKLIDPYLNYCVSDPAIASISGNVLSGLKAGSTSLVVSYKNLGSVTINITVTIL